MQYRCGHCRWAGPEGDLATGSERDSTEFWGVPGGRVTFYICPECGSDEVDESGDDETDLEENDDDT